MIENDAQMDPGQDLPRVVPAPDFLGFPRLRPGRKNPRNLYLQMGSEPDETVDLPIGYLIDTDVAALIGEGLTSPWHLNEIRLSAEARQDEPRLGR